MQLKCNFVYFRRAFGTVRCNFRNAHGRTRIAKIAARRNVRRREIWILIRCTPTSVREIVFGERRRSFSEVTKRYCPDKVQYGSPCAQRAIKQRNVETRVIYGRYTFVAMEIDMPYASFNKHFARARRKGNLRPLAGAVCGGSILIRRSHPLFY